ncbi:hypothetical protein MARHY1895 [Marinobacter nauticus ATCC 49840]|nr:hypothetical protein MARHY1895 [Marinobacter nauticus ATCC 49840]
MADAPTLRSGTPQRQALSNHLNVRFATVPHPRQQKLPFNISVIRYRSACGAKQIWCGSEKPRQTMTFSQAPR